MAVVDVGVGDDVDQLPRRQAGDPGKHVQEHGVLHHVPAVGSEHILAALVEHGVEHVSGDVEGHRPGAGVEAHVVEVVVVVEAGEDAPGGGVVLQIVEHPVHLVHLPLGVLVLDPQLVAVGLADGAVPVGPGVPDVGVEVADVVGLPLPDPQQLVHRVPKGHFSEGLDGKLLPEVVAVDNPEALDGVGGGPVGPPGPDRQVRVPGPVGQNLLAVGKEDFVGIAHGVFPLSCSIFPQKGIFFSGRCGTIARQAASW